MDPEPVLCPSAPATPGALLIGRFGPDGELGMLRQRLAIDADFLEAARRGGRIPEQTFRFSSPCLKGGCGQWAGGGCGIARGLAALPSPNSLEEASLPACAIRDQCRWFAQEGAAVCGICPQVATSQPALTISNSPL